MSYIELSNFQKYAGSVISRRGKMYWMQGLVKLVSVDGNRYVAKVFGTDEYETVVEIDGNEVVSHSCTCPYNGNLCKHEVALLLEIKDCLTSGRPLIPSSSVSQGASHPSLQSQPFSQMTLSGFETDGASDSFHLLGVELTKKELFLLGVLTCSGYKSLSDLRYIPAYAAKGMKITAQERNASMISLSNKGFLTRNRMSWGGSEYTLRSDLCLDVLKEIIENHPNWLNFYRQELHPAPKEEYLVEVVEALLGKRETIEHEWSDFKYENEDENYIYRVINQIVLREDEDKFLRIVKPERLLINLHLLLDDVMDHNNPHILERIAIVLNRFSDKNDNWHVAYHHLRLFVFYATGTLLPWLETRKQSSYCYYTDAVVALYEDRLDDAILLFHKGLSMRRDKDLWKHVPYDTVTFFLYVVALGRRRNAQDIETLRKLYDYRYDSKAQWCSSVFVLLNFFQSNRQPKETNALEDIVLGNKSTVLCNKCVAAIILGFFGEVESIKASFPKTEIAVLKCEMSSFGLSDSGTWPYEPALDKFKPVETWKMELLELINDASQISSSSMETGEPAGRLVYIVKHYEGGYRISEIREQKRLKSGNWGKGRKLSYYVWAEGNVAMDDIDKQIHTEWMSKYAYRGYYGEIPKLQIVLPYLKGTDKLLREAKSETVPINLREETPFVFTETDGDMIRFGTNIPSKGEYYSSLMLDNHKKDEWVFYKASQRAFAMISRLVGLKSVPVSAEPMLEQLFENLKGQVEIHSEIAGGLEIGKVEGNTRLTLRIIPQKDAFDISLYLFPVEGGARSFFPGTGTAVYYDINDGVKVEVVRDLKKEKRALKALNQVLNERLHIGEFSLQSPDIQITTTDLLELVESRSNYSDLFELEWPEGEPFRLREVDGGSWKVSANPVGGWFELEGDIHLTDDYIVSMGQLLSLIREGDGRFIRLGDSDYVHLSDSLRSQLLRIDTLAQRHGDKVRLSEVAMAVSGDSLQGEMEIEEPDALLVMRRRIRESEDMEVEIPDNLNAVLRDYQEDGVRWMLRMTSWGAGVCLADDMGLGKTLQTIAVMLSRKSEGAQMVVAPASVAGNWRREVERFAPSLNIVMLNELNINDRASAVSELGPGDLLVLTYGLLVSECENLISREWASVCLDEAHTIKNRETKSSAAAMQLKAGCRIILTGTPIQNHLGELWNLMQFINPGLLGSYDHFNMRFIAPIAAGRQEPRSQLKRLIAPFMLRRTKQEVVRELPDKEEIMVPVAMSPEEMAVYEVIRRQAKSELESSSTLSVNALALITKLREAACSATLADKALSIPSSKLDVLLDKLTQIIQQGNRVLVFSQFTSFLDMAIPEMEAAGIHDYFYLNGSTPLRDRSKMVEEFQKGHKAVFLVSLKAGGLGLNLTGANYVIHLDPWWNPAIEQQATDRAYRIGQKQKVTVYHLIAENTIEEKILRLHQTKRSLADSLLQGTDMSHKLITQDLLDMIV